MIVQFYEVKVVFLRKVRFIISAVLTFSFYFVFATISNADFLRPCSYTVGWIADNRVENWSFSYETSFAHVKAECTNVHSHEIRYWHSVILEISVDVKLFDFFKSLDALV